MEVKTIKGINETTWAEFKSLAAKKRVTMGELLKMMVEEYSKNSEEFWDSILNGEKNLSEKEAEEMLSISKKIRKKKGFRR